MKHDFAGLFNATNQVGHKTPERAREGQRGHAIKPEGRLAMPPLMAEDRQSSSAQCPRPGPGQLGHYPRGLRHRTTGTPVVGLS